MSRSVQYLLAYGADSSKSSLIRRTPESPGVESCKRKFLGAFPKGFSDATYLAWERNYKWEAHQRWEEILNRKEMESLIGRHDYGEIARRAIQIESRTNLLFSFEKMALRDAVRKAAGARAFAVGLHQFLFGSESQETRFEGWRDVVGALPRRQTRVLTWPVVSVFPFLAQPARHFFVKPMVCRRAAERYGFPFEYRSRPDWETYSQYLKFARTVKRDLAGMHPRDMIDIQSFLWVQGSDEYA